MRLVRSVSWVLAALVLFGARSATAWPVDFYFDLEMGEPKMKTLATIDWAQMQDESIATVEITATNDLLLTPKKPGRTLLLLYAQGRFALWRIRVSPEGVHHPEVPEVKGPLEAAKKACPGIQFSEVDVGPEQATLTSEVKTEACRKALWQLFQTDAFRARRAELTYEVPVLQGQLAQYQAAVEKIAPGKVTLRYSGAGLVATGEVTLEEKKKLFFAWFELAAGALPTEDRLKVPDPAPDSEDDAGTK